MFIEMEEESVETFLAYCDMKNYRPPETDCYGWARMCQVIGNFFGNSTNQLKFEIVLCYISFKLRSATL